MNYVVNVLFVTSLIVKTIVKTKVIIKRSNKKEKETIRMNVI